VLLLRPLLLVLYSLHFLHININFIYFVYNFSTVTVEDEILALEQIGANLIISKINEKSDKKVSLKLNKEGWNAGLTDGKNGEFHLYRLY
jgi:hypothetical protein